ncbi:MAG: LCP family protein [Lachnospiraceae bacterium]|nr:LCP family protein [Lachnospiraceae bacterium]
MKNSFKIRRGVLKFFMWLIIICVIGFIIFLGLRISGKNRLYRKSENKRPDLNVAMADWAMEEGNDADADTDVPTESVPLIQIDEDNENWEEGDIRYKGVHYRYNDEMLTFLFLGIDKKGTVKEAKNSLDGGQSDAIFLLALNPKTMEASVIGINRDTMADIDMYSQNGTFLGTVQAQLTLQHGYGDGKEQSCERSVAAVSKLFYNLPIHGYCAINLGAIPKINDAVGGVDLVVLEDITSDNKLIFKEGQQVHLKGENAAKYLRARDCTSFGSAGRRTERQKQYLLAYADTAKKAIKKDVSLLVKLYNTIKKYMVTDVTVDEVSYFSTQVADYKFDKEHIYSVPGETQMGEKFEEFYVDEKGMYELILKVFYDVIED